MKRARRFLLERILHRQSDSTLAGCALGEAGNVFGEPVNVAGMRGIGGD